MEKMKHWQNEMSEKFSDTFNSLRKEVKGGDKSIAMVSVDLREKNDSYILRMHLPDRDLDQVEVTLENNNLSITAPAEGKAARYQQTLVLSGLAADAKPVELVGGVPKAVTAEDLLKEELLAVKVRKAKGSKNITSGIANIAATFNNTIVSITDAKGNVISWSSAGKCNFRGSRKSTAYAAQVVAQDAARNAMAHGLKEVQIRVSGPGLGRDSAIRGLQAIGLEISSIIDVTPVPQIGRAHV